MGNRGCKEVVCLGRDFRHICLSRACCRAGPSGVGCPRIRHVSPSLSLITGVPAGRTYARDNSLGATDLSAWQCDCGGGFVIDRWWRLLLGLKISVRAQSVAKAASEDVAPVRFTEHPGCVSELGVGTHPHILCSRCFQCVFENRGPDSAGPCSLLGTRPTQPRGGVPEGGPERWPRQVDSPCSPESCVSAPGRGSC